MPPPLPPASSPAGPRVGTGLYELWKRGLYRNYAPDKLVDLVARLLALVPPWVRVYRIQRDIPMPLVTSGVDKGNLRELALARMAALGLRCRSAGWLACWLLGSMLCVGVCVWGGGRHGSSV